MNALVSIIIPTYNRGHLLGDTLNSVLAQTYQHWECIIVDDGSIDATAQIVAQYIKQDSRFAYYKRPEHYPKGGNGARNFGFDKSKGVYINWFDDDDLLMPKKLELQISILEQSTKEFVVCQTLVFDHETKKDLGLRWGHIHSNKPLEDFITCKNVFLTQAPIFKRHFLETYDLKFDLDLKSSQEWEFFCRCIFFAKDYERTLEPLVHLRRNPNSISTQKNKAELFWNYYLARLKVFKFLKQQGSPKTSEVFFEFYFKDYFFKTLFDKNTDTSRVFKIYFETIVVYYNLKEKVLLFLYIILVRLTGKGFKFKKRFFKK